MSDTFNAACGLVIVRARVYGLAGDGFARLALDTGAATTLLRPTILTAIGYDLTQATDTTQIVTASGIETMTRFPVDRFAALGQERTQFIVIAHALPPIAGVDGVLGLDFLRGQVLTLDFVQGKLDLL